MLSQFWLPSIPGSEQVSASQTPPFDLSLDFSQLHISREVSSTQLVCLFSADGQDKQAKVQSDFTVTILLLFQNLVSLFWGRPF